MEPESLRIYADFNSVDDEGWCWCLRYEKQPLDDFADAVGLVEGMAVVIYYEDPAEDFEFDATLSCRPSATSCTWMAFPHEGSFRVSEGFNNMKLRQVANGLTTVVPVKATTRQ
jgi:hypothetical protein